MVKFLSNNFKILKDSLVVLETTGGYENGLLSFLVEKNICVHRADTRKVKNFIRSYGQKAKTDKIDALALASYGAERHSKLKLFRPAESTQNSLKVLEERRLDLKQMLVQEKNRLKAPLNESLKPNIQAMIAAIESSMQDVNVQIEKLIAGSDTLKKKLQILREIPGIGDVTSKSLVCLLPELGHVDCKSVASLCGVAPHAKQSGTKIWYSRTFGGRRNLRPVLFMAAMAARNSKSLLGKFYENLLSRGKKKMVALVALMRKIIVIANARIRDTFCAQDSSQALIC